MKDYFKKYKKFGYPLGAIINERLQFEHILYLCKITSLTLVYTVLLLCFVLIFMRGGSILRGTAEECLAAFLLGTCSATLFSSTTESTRER